SQTDDLLRLNPSDIQSFSILKDGASSAIYGARSAFGVILITTKKGASGGNQNISYNDYFAISKPTNLPTPITDPYIEKAVKYLWSDYDFSNYHNLSISGSSPGSKPINYLLSADYTKENGLLKIAKDDWTRYGLRANIGINPLSWLNVQNNLTVYQLKNDRPS